MDKHPLGGFEEPSKVLAETKQLWKSVFGDDDRFIDLYFSRVFKPEYNVTCQINGKVAGALQKLPYKMLIHGTEISTSYVSGVCSDPDMRNEGIGNAIMRQAHIQMHATGTVIATLIPAEEWLRHWYSKMGYVEHIVCTPPPANVMDMNFEEFDKMQRAKECVLLHNDENLEVIKKDIEIAGEQYHPATKPTTGMLRIINAKKALEMYATMHPDVYMKIHVRADKDIPANNAYYTIDHGGVTRTDRPCGCCPKMTIGELGEMIFKDEKAEMFLMLN